MKKLLAVLVLVLFGTMTYAQWTAGPGNLWNQTTGKIGVNINAPTELMHIYTTGGGTAGDSRAVFLAESGYSALPASPKTLGGFQANNVATTEKFIMALRKNPGTGFTDILQSVYCLTPTPGWVEYQLLRFDTRKWEMKQGVVDAEFKNSGVLYLNNGTATGVFDPLVSGKVGIGTTSIASGVRLQVGGKVKCQEVEVAVTPWPDHVFKAGFNLMPLEEVAAYVQTNKHLPGVPSEEEVAANGVNVGAMNATLLQKVEELTLYMINLKNENDALKARVSNLEK
jgi:hypothetical protein